jgi:hypothetical protein
MRALGLQASLLGLASGPLTLLGADLLGPTGGVRNKRPIGATQPAPPLFLRHPGAASGGGASCGPFALIQGAGSHGGGARSSGGGTRSHAG